MSLRIDHTCPPRSFLSESWTGNCPLNNSFHDNFAPGITLTNEITEKSTGAESAWTHLGPPPRHASPQCETNTEKGEQIRQLRWMATHGIFIYFKWFLLGEPHEIHMRCVSYFQRSVGGNSCHTASFQNSLVPYKRYDGGQTTYTADHLRQRPQLWPVGLRNSFWTRTEMFPTINECSDLRVLNQASCSRTMIKVVPRYFFPSERHQSASRKFTESLKN